jgi:HAD superfamily hydrolase (TIGR01509 family)
MDRAEADRLFIGGTIKGLCDKARDLGADLPDDWIDDFYSRLYARLAQGVGLISGVTDVLDRLDAAGIRYAIGSNGSGKKMEITLGQHPDLRARIAPHIYSGQDLGCPKPDPGLWLHAARALNIAPEHCVVVDDSPTGCLGAANAKIRCFGLAEHDDGARLAANGAEVIHRLADLPARIGL